MITVTNLSKIINSESETKKLFENVSLSFEENNSYIITGKSGIGKSTFLSIIAGFDTPTTGIVTIDKKNIHTMTAKEQSFFRIHTIGFLFQKSYLITEVSILENIMLPIFLSKKTNHETETRAKNLLSSLGLLKKQYLSPAQLSGGEQQRIALARAISNNPRFLYADEPTAFLDKTTGTFILEWIFQYINDHKMGLIMNSHDQSSYRYAKNILTLQNQNLRPFNI